jgi:hypothetical protein
MVIGPELRLIINACRAAFAGERLTADHNLVDWGRTLRLARFHRVQGLLWQSLASQESYLPREVARKLSDDAQSIARANLEAAIESRDLLAAFGQAHIPCLTVKGLALATLAYGTIATKSSVDIDLLIPEADLDRGAQLLSSLGYELSQPAIRPTDRRLGRWHRLRKESTWTHASRGAQVDLHTRLADNPALIPAIGIKSPQSEVEVARGIILPTLAPDQLFAYLCVHGSSSLWFRLKWLTDLAALLHRTDPAEIERLYRRSQELGAGRAADLALLLADTVYDTLAPCPKLRDRLCGERANGWLLSQAVKQLAGTPEPVEPTSQQLGTLRIHLVQIALLPGATLKVGEFVRQARAVLG